MNCKFLSVATFDRELKRLSKKYKSLKRDIENLKAEIEINPFLGTDLGEGYKKIRLEIASKNKGKKRRRACYHPRSSRECKRGR